MLVLVDVSYDTIVAYKVVEDETEEEVLKFLKEATSNQERKAINRLKTRIYVSHQCFRI
ncbi:hypothetical protein PXD04_00645 [Methanosphaera sp. ISO3-F5]|uniref:hypothetical protein n=1 Tax=Methanosphaera sp. ISO3-F5 TaxID=1452353 RepID=UPI002B25F64A|nr:hypothetical protein [Methanosphaera sp. ISO3-F5]WQH64337.1 hypothetical protein PXD04_00645 [Methanosphaera sp. ISO3-F5]